MIITGGSGFSISGVSFSVSNAVPGAPTITSVTTGSRASGSMTLSYSAPAFTGYPGAITGYTAFSRPGCISTTTNSTASSGTLSFTGLTNGSAYNFKIYATNCQGHGSFGYYCGCSIVTAASAPCAPTIGVAAATCTPGQVTVNYTAPACNGGSTITSYTAVSVPGCYSGTYIGTGSGSITINCIPQGASYAFKVDATNAIGTSAYSPTSNSVTVPVLGYKVSYLIVAGGGGGGGGYSPYGCGGGGGGGGLLGGTILVRSSTVYPVVVGGGGSAGGYSYCGVVGSTATTGTVSSAFSISAVGGGRGGSKHSASLGVSGGAGGSGGGASSNGGPATICGGAGTPGQGYPGGGSNAGGVGNGGGGAGSTSLLTGSGYRGGTGTFTTIITASIATSLSVGQVINNVVYFAGGGAGGYDTAYITCSSKRAPGGWGGGGYGGYFYSSTIVEPGTAGTANTGGGGGGGSRYCGYAGGSGVVIIAYTATSQIGTGGTVNSFTASGVTHWVHTFKSSGNYTA